MLRRNEEEEWNRINICTIQATLKWTEKLTLSVFTKPFSTDPSLPDTPAPTSSDYVTIANDSFKSVSQPMTWNAARRNCQADGAQLVSIRSELSQSYIELTVLTLNAPLWIGLNSIEVQDSLKKKNNQIIWCELKKKNMASMDKKGLLMLNVVKFFFPRLVVISGLFLAGISPQLTGALTNHKETGPVCLSMTMGNGGLLIAIGRWPAFVWNLQVGFMYLLRKNIFTVIMFIMFMPTQCLTCLQMCHQQSQVNSKDSVLYI